VEEETTMILYRKSSLKIRIYLS